MAQRPNRGTPREGEVVHGKGKIEFGRNEIDDASLCSRSTIGICLFSLYKELQFGKSLDQWPHFECQILICL